MIRTQQTSKGRTFIVCKNEKDKIELSAEMMKLDKSRKKMIVLTSEEFISKLRRK